MGKLLRCFWYLVGVTEDALGMSKEKKFWRWHWDCHGLSFGSLKFCTSVSWEGSNKKAGILKV